MGSIGRWLAWHRVASVVGGLAGVAILAALVHADSPSPDEKVPAIRYSLQIRPLLAERCFTCHGPDPKSRQGDLRLDTYQGATESAIEPGKPDESVLIERLMATDPGEQMPPPRAKKPPLTPGEVALLRQWIQEGAKYEPHWAFIPPRRPAAPQADPQGWSLGPIDRFVAAGHKQQRFKPAADAAPHTLVRRLHFDLLGLPAGAAELDAFVTAPTAENYAAMVERLLASPHFGERLSVVWLDLVRYADSCGYHSDNPRNVWMYRDYVIAAFNANKPFKQFTLEQLAGDLLPNPTQEQLVATGYNRLLQTTEEGGAQPKEYTAKFVADRVRNTATAWLGLTMGCAECHDHKYDPLKTRDFYRFGAFFADIDELPVQRQVETKLPTTEQAAKLAELDATLVEAQQRFDAATPEFEAGLAKWLEAQQVQPAADLPGAVKAALKVPADERNDRQERLLANHYRSTAAEFSEQRTKMAAAQKVRDEFAQTIPATLITKAVSPRVVRVLPRGNWLDDSGEIVTPEIPELFGALDIKNRRPTRLDLAEWLVDPRNPLVARVFVNHLWRQFFGQGLVKTANDFGTQGALPTHPELLDWLAVEFVESGWDVKHVVRLMVLSRTYRQSSIATPEMLSRDPGNVWLARQGRFRLDAEFVRDNALSIAGVLTPQIGGPSVKPYQPRGYWAYLNFPTREWQNDKGENQYRRGLYTHWQRTFLHPSLLAFDASSREECTVERPRSNTPLQALVLLNDPTYVEAARLFAVRVMREGGREPAERIQFAFRHALGRAADEREQEALSTLFKKHLSEFTADEKAARQFLSIGDAQTPEDIQPAELAAWTSVARAMLNLHETITRE